MTNTRTFKPSQQIPLGSLEENQPILPFNRKIGHMKVGPNRPIGKKERKYFAACDCGHSDWYTVEALSEILNRWGGCGQPNCTALNFGELVWTTEDSLRIQHTLLLILCPEEVESWWGGTMDDVHELDRYSGYRNLEEYLLEQGYSGVWLGRKNTLLPFMESNVVLSAEPDSVFQRFSKAKVEVDGQQFTMKELCSISGMSADQLLITIYELGTTDDLLFYLLEK